jgi:hypothetical protein
LDERCQATLLDATPDHLASFWHVLALSIGKLEIIATTAASFAIVLLYLIF